VFSFRGSFIPSGKQGGGATVLRERRDIVTKETCVPTSLSICNLGKAAVLHFAFIPSAAGDMPNSACSHRLLIICSPYWILYYVVLYHPITTTTI
jgi:hypothetical protein